MPMAGLLTTTAAMRWGKRHGGMQRDRAADGDAGERDLPAMPSASISAARSSTIVSMVSAPRTFSDSPAPRVS